MKRLALLKLFSFVALFLSGCGHSKQEAYKAAMEQCQKQYADAARSLSNLRGAARVNAQFGVDQEWQDCKDIAAEKYGVWPY